MKAAMNRYREGKPVRFPFPVLVHLVAATYGQTPASVREWPADDFLMACNIAELTRG